MAAEDITGTEKAMNIMNIDEKKDGDEVMNPEEMMTAEEKTDTDVVETNLAEEMNLAEARTLAGTVKQETTRTVNLTLDDTGRQMVLMEPILFLMLSPTDQIP